jgi:hypothetical protein
MTFLAVMTHALRFLNQLVIYICVNKTRRQLSVGRMRPHEGRRTLLAWNLRFLRSGCTHHTPKCRGMVIRNQKGRLEMAGSAHAREALPEFCLALDEASKDSRARI